MNWEACGGKRSWSNLNYPIFFLEGLKKSMKIHRLDSQSSGRDINPGCPEYEWLDCADNIKRRARTMNRILVTLHWTRRSKCPKSFVSASRTSTGRISYNLHARTGYGRFCFVVAYSEWHVQNVPAFHNSCNICNKDFIMDHTSIKFYAHKPNTSFTEFTRQTHSNGSGFEPQTRAYCYDFLANSETSSLNAPRPVPFASHYVIIPLSYLELHNFASWYRAMWFIYIQHYFIFLRR
jgi:hypothetical protein